MVNNSNPLLGERKILFYRADIGHSEDGFPLPFDPSPALDAIRMLPVTDDEMGWYEHEVDGNALCLFQHGRHPYPTVRFCRVRRTSLPLLERAGEIQDLELDAETGLLEAIHVVFFPNNVIGTEYNHYGPRVSRLGGYLHERSRRAIPRPTFLPILRGDAAAQLDRLSDLRVLDINIVPAIADLVGQSAPSLSAAFTANTQILENPKELHLTLKPDLPSQSGFLNKMIGPLKEMIGSSSIRDGSKRLEVRGRCQDSGQIETIDLFEGPLDL